MVKSDLSQLDLREIQKLLIEHMSSREVDFYGGKRRNVNPKSWGASGWKFLDKIVEGYPVRATHDDQVQMLDFLTSLGYALPCARCRDNYRSFTFNYPPIEYVQGRRDVKAWLQAYKRKSKLNK